MEKKILHLSVKREWFDLIKAGTKREEYREIKDYWINRFVKNPYGFFLKAACGKEIIIKSFTHVVFINGYGANRPRIEKEIESITIGKPKKGLCPDEFLGNDYFIIKFK